MANIESLTKTELIGVLEHVQHFMPPRATRQDKETLVSAVRKATFSGTYGATARAALADAWADRRRRGLPTTKGKVARFLGK